MIPHFQSAAPPSGKALEVARRAIGRSKASTRLEVIIKLWSSGALRPHEWLGLLRDEWSSCADLTRHAERLWNDTPFGWLTVLPELQKFLMNIDEIEAFSRLPDGLTLYRVGGVCDGSGLCWTLDRNRAALSASAAKARQGHPAMIITARARKAQVAALKLEATDTTILALLHRQAARRR
jgi:hypothetical protein